MTARDYAAVIVPRIQDLVTSQLPSIEAAGRLVAGAIGDGHVIWLTQTSHTIHLEGTHRAGGLMAARTLESIDEIERGDVVIIGTSAGTSQGTVDLAEEAHARGAVVIALTGVAFENDPRMVRGHANGRVLHEEADLTVDLASPFGDGEFTLAGTGVQILPSSGATGVVALWMIFAEAVSILVADGKVPLMWQSNIVPGGQARNETISADYARTKRGYAAAD